MADPNTFSTLQPALLAEANNTLSAYDMYMRTPNVAAELAGQESSNDRTAFQKGQINYADAPSTSLVPSFVRSPDPMLLDPDAFGVKTADWAKRNGQVANSGYVAGLNVFGRPMSRDQLMASESGRQLLDIATKNREGKKRSFIDAITDFEWGDLPFVGMIASVGGSISDAVTVSDTMRKLQDGEAVTDDELIKTRLYMAKQERDAEGTWGSTVGSIVRAAPGFMLEMWASGGLAAGARSATAGGIHFGMTRAAKILAREATEDLAEKVIVKAGVAKSAGEFAKLATSAEGKQVTKDVARQLYGFMKSSDAAHMYKSFSDDALHEMAENRAKYELEKLVARKGGSMLSNGFNNYTQWLGSYVSRGLMDYGSWGTEEATKLFTRQSTAGRALADAMGVFTVEAPIKGTVLMLPKAAVTQGVVAPLAGQDGRVVSDSQLSLQMSALMTGNRQLMDNAESIATGMNLLEYISENTGSGLKSLLAAGGIGLERLGVKGLVRPLQSAVSSAGRSLPVDGTEAYTIGGRLRKFLLDRFGSRQDFAKRMAGEEARLVAERLGVRDVAGMSAVRSAVMARNATGLPAELQAAVGGDFGKFIKETVDQAYERGKSDLLYKTHARYSIAKWMTDHQVGPETVMNMFNQMGYDGVLGEMFEERYSDFAKGLFGLDDRAEHSFGSNLKEAIKGLYPGWDQLTAEAVGFAFPMVTRGVAMRAMSAIGGGGALAELRSRLDVIDDAMRHNTVGEMTYSQAQEAFAYASERDDREIAELNRKLQIAETVGDKVQADSLGKEIAKRQEVAKRRVERQEKFFASVDEAAKNTADALIAVPMDTYGTLSYEESADRAPVLTESEARQVLDAQQALGDFASQLARQLVEGQLPLEGESEGAFRKIARRLVGISGFLVTGDFSLAAYNPAQWTARDMGLSKRVVDGLRDGFRDELTRVRKAMPDGTPVKEVLDEAQRRFDLRARQIMASNLAVHQLRSFSDGRLRETAAAQWAATHPDADGRQWQYAVDGEGRGVFYKFADDGKSVDEATSKTLADMYRDHGTEIEAVKRDILKATVDIMTRRLTGSDAGRNAVLSAMELGRNGQDTDMLDVALYDAAMHMIGAQDVIYRVSLDGQTPLKAMMDSRSLARVSEAAIDYIASAAKLDDVNKLAIETVAQALGLRFDGTEEGLARRNDKVFRIAKLLRLNRREGRLFYSKEILDDEDALRMSANGTSTLVADRQEDGSYTVDFGVKKDAPKERDVRTFADEAALSEAMQADGYVKDDARVILTQAKVIESSDMFWMIRELGLAREYFDALGDRKQEQMHPMLRRGDDGRFMNAAAAEGVLAKELAEAEAGRTAQEGSAARVAYNRVFGEDGYMAVGERLLADHGVHKDSLAPFVGEFHEYAPVRYTLSLSAGQISPKSADVYVPVDPKVDSDMTGGVVKALLLNAYAKNGALLRDSLGGTVSDFVKDVRRIAKDALAEAQDKGDTELANQLITFMRMCCDDVDRMVRREDGKPVVKKGVGMSPAGFAVLADAFGLFRARTDSVNPMVRALSTIAPRVWASPSFLAFEGLLNVTLGGNFLDTAIWSAKPGTKDYADPALTGIPQIMALANADPLALRNAVQASLPAELGYEQFLDAVTAQLAAQSKTGSPEISEEEKRELRAKARAAAAANADPAAHFSFLGGVISTMKAAVDNKVVVSKSVADFLESVLAAVSQDPKATDRQRQAAVKQLEYIRRRSTEDEAERTYVRKVEELAETQEKLRAAEAKVADLRNRLVDLERRAMSGEAVQDSDRQNGQVALADATAELEDFAAELLEKQSAVTGAPAPEGLQALHLGGDTAGSAGIDPGNVTALEDDGDATVANDPSATDVPEVFGREASRREDGYTVEWGRPFDENVRRLTRRQARLAAGVVVRSMVDEVSEDSFLARLSDMFPHMSEADRRDVLEGFRGLDAARIAAGRAWDDVVFAGQHFGFEDDEKSDEDRSSDNFNERALAEYNSESLKDFTALLRRAASETNGSIMGFVEMLRGRTRVRAADAAAQDLLNGLLNPQMLPGVKNLAQADALHKNTLKRFAESGIRDSIDALLKEDPQAAFLVAYLSSLPVAARTRFAGLCSGSIATTPVHVVNGIAEERSLTPDGKIPDTLVTDSFDRLVGLSAHRLTKLAASLREGARALVPSLSGGSAGLGSLKANAQAVADLLATVIGRNNPLYNALTSSIAETAWARTTREQMKALYDSVSWTVLRKNREGKTLAEGIPVVETIAAAIEQLASRGRKATRLDVESTFIAALTMGGSGGNVGLARAPSRMDMTDPLLAFLNQFQAALPRTMMRSEIDQSREQVASSVVVAPRGMVPLLSRWLYQQGEGSFEDVCRKAWPDVTEETLAECRQDGTWPDDARTPICAKMVSSSLTPSEVYRACRDTYKANPKRTWWVPIYSGDHSSFTMLQVPAKVGFGSGVDYKEAAKAAYKAIGMDLMFTDTKRSAVSSLEAQGTGLVGVTASSAAHKQALERVEQLRGSEGNHVLSPVRPSTARPTAKDQRKFNQLGGITKYIGFGRAGSSTEHYGNTAFASIRNTGAYTASDVVGVSVNGAGASRVALADRRFREELAKATAAGAILVADTKAYRESSSYNIGEHELAGYLSAHGYEELDGSGIWVPASGQAYGEHRVHIVHSWEYENPKYAFARDGKEADKNAAFLGSTFMHGYGAEQIGNMSADPESNTKKVHVVGGAGRDLFFIKSLTISQNGLRGKFREGSAPRAVFDYLEKFRGNDSLSTDTLTDDDSYKIGPGNSKGLRVVNDGKDVTVMKHVFGRLYDVLVESGDIQRGADMDALAKAFKSRYSKLTGDELDALVGPMMVADRARGTTSEMKLSEIMPDAMVNVFEGWSGPALDLSYREDSAMAYTVANVAHRSNVPAEPGRSPRNYEVDALAMVRTLAEGNWLKTPGVVSRFHELMANWGLLASSVYSDPKFRKAMIQLDENLAELRRNGEFVSADGRFSGQFAVEEITRQIMAKTRQAANLPLQGIDAPLVAAGASLDVDGRLVVHTTSRMEAAMLKGSELFTDEESAFYGANRRLALCNVNVSNNGFRYGWFLAKDAETRYPEAYIGGDAMKRPGTNAARRHANAIAWAAMEVRRATQEADANPTPESKKAALVARKAFASMFVDHRGIGISEYGDRYLSTFSVEDLFVPTNSDAEDFDYSAVQCEGQDLVFNDTTGEEHVFLGGTLFGLPRTPSYNGSMWLQTVRAGLPVTEEIVEDAPAGTRNWRAGGDAMVSPDPYTNAILGCDHDGDKTKLYMFSVNGAGAVRYMDIPSPGGPLYADGTGVDFKARDEFLNKAAAAGLVEGARIDESGNEAFVPKDQMTADSYWRISNIVRKRVSNTFVRTLFSLSRQLPVDGVEDHADSVELSKRPAAGAADGTPRTKFLGGVASSATKAFPTGNKKSLLKAGLPEVISPDGSKGTLGDPELAMEIATSAKDAGEARGVMVSLARTLHVAWALGTYNGERSLLGPMTGMDWLRFMYHVDGLSNATFDDIKEQVCGRLGWTKGMMDSVLVEILMSGGLAPVTDAEFDRILKDYAGNISRHGSRYWMMRNSRMDDGEAYGLVAQSFMHRSASGAKKRFTRSSLMSSLEVEETEVAGANGVTRIAPVADAPSNVGTAVGRAVVELAQAKRLLSMASRDSGRDPAVGLLYGAVVRGLHDSGLDRVLRHETLSDGTTGWSFDVSEILSSEELETAVKGIGTALKDMRVDRWLQRRGQLLEARAVGQSLNYLTADPGAPAAQSSKARAIDSFAGLEDSPAPARGGLPEGVVWRMHEATVLMYEVGEDLATSVSRAVAAAQRREDLVLDTLARSDRAREAAGRLLAKDTVSARNLQDLQHNQQQIPLLAEFFAGAADDILSRVQDGLTGASVYGMLKKFAEGVSGSVARQAKDEYDKAAKRVPKGAYAQAKLVGLKQKLARDGFVSEPLAARVAVESMLRIAYELMVTSSELASSEDNRAAAFLRSAPDTSFAKGQDFYGTLASELYRIMPMFRANDRQALDKVRDMFARVIDGRAFAGKRTLAGDSAGYTKAGSFNISRKNLLAYATELSAGKAQPKTLEDIERLAIRPDAKQAIRRAWQALGDDKTSVSPAVLFGALLPAYTLMTSRMSGAPNVDSTSVLGLLPLEYYQALSAGEARRRASGDTIVPLMVGSVWAPKTFRPGRGGVQEAGDYGVDGGEDLATARNRLRGGAGLTEGRRNPAGRDVVDVFDPAFEAAIGALGDTATARPTTLPKATTASNLGRGAYDPATAKLALAMGSLLGSWATVEYNGGTTFTIRGSLSGDAGAGKAVSIVVDASGNPLIGSEEDVERLADSSAYAASLTAAVNLGITAEEFLILPKDVRRALVRRFGLGGATSGKVEWTVGARGVATLVGRISVPAGGTKVYHEYFHSMMRMFESFALFGEEDYRQLADTFGEDPSGRHRFNEEKAAESFRKWVEGNSDAKADSVRTVFQRILDFLKGLLEALKKGFSYKGNEETLFRMMVHGIAQPSTDRIEEARMESVAAASAIRSQFQLPAAERRTRSELEERARQDAPAVPSARVSELEELDNSWQADESLLKRSESQAANVLARISDAENGAESFGIPLQRLARTRAEIAQQLGVAVDSPSEAGTPDMAVGAPVDAVADSVRRITSPLVNNNLFYRTANSIRQALEAGLHGSGAWTDDLEYVVRRYSANDSLSLADENLRRQAIVHGLRKAMAQVNPAAAKALSNREIMDSLAYRAALVMHQHLESSFLNGRPAGASPSKEAARHASQYQVSAWIMSTDPVAPSRMVTDARDRISELYNASPSGASKAELKMHLDQMDALFGIVGDPTGLSQFRRDQGMSTINEVIGNLRAGTRSDGVDETGGLKDIAPIDPVDADGNPTTLNPKAQKHLDSFSQSHTDPAVQESLKLALTTAYQVAAMAKYYGELDVHPAPAGDIAEAKRLARLNGIPEHMTSVEFLGEHLVGDSNLVDNPAYVDYQCQSHFIAQNVDAWLRSMVRDSFGAHEGLGRMMSDEHFEYRGLVSAITLKENWVAHMLGVSLEPGGELLEVIRQKGEYRMENGEVIRKVGDEYVRFDNYGRKSTSVKMTEEDLRRVDMWLKMCAAHANGAKEIVTGVDDLSFYSQMSRKPEDYSIAAVTAKRERNERMNPVEWAVWRMTRQVPADLLDAVHRRFVGNVLAAMAEADKAMKDGTRSRGRYTLAEPMVYDAATYNSFVIGELVRKGVAVGYNPGGSFHKGGLPRYENAALVIGCDFINDRFLASDTYRKLTDENQGGRDPSWVDRDFISREFMSVWNDTVRFVKRHPWLTHGDGQYFHAFGTALPFWRGSGVFMYNAVRTDRKNRITLSDKMSEAEAMLERITKSPLADRQLSTLDPKSIVDDMDFLARFAGARHRATQFLEDVLAGRYATGERDSVETGLTLPADATYGDIARAMYQKAREAVWMSRTGHAGARHLDLEGVIERYESTKLERGEVFGGSMGFRDTDMYRMHGTLPANYQIGHKVHKCIDGITNAMMSRATLANLLLTPEGSTGAPVYYADPSELAAEASGLPDEFWGNVAEWWQEHNRSSIGQVYDPAASGVQNAKAVYAAIRQKHQIEGKKRKYAVGSLGYTELPGDDSQLVSVDRWMVLDGNGEDFMNATAGGEAMGYLKHYLDAGKTLGFGGAKARAAIQRALSYSKSLSVSFSFFFPMATRWESPMGAVGAMSTIGSNWKKVGDWMKEHPEAANRIRGMFGGKAWVTHDYIGMRDIVSMMDSNDPFIADLYSWAAALGITVSTSVTNPMEPDKTVLLKDVRRMKEAIRSSMGAEAAGKFARMMDVLLVRQGDKAFNYVLNATKLAVVAQMCMKLRHQAKAQGKAFDPVRDLRKYARYINAEIGGIDPMQFAWAHPKARSLMNAMLFSWQWTVGAWQAGGGSVITDMFTGGHTMTKQEREYFAGRWMRMFLGVMIGVPALFQVVTLALAKAMGGGDDDDDRWGTWENEDKTKWTAFDLTPFLKALARLDETKLGGALRAFKTQGRPYTTALGAAAGAVAGAVGGGNWLTSAIGAAVGSGSGALTTSLVPLYTGRDPANATTRNRRYYMHFGKQGWEFFRWFDDAKGQFFSKMSMPIQRVAEGVMGRSLGYLDRSLPWDEMGQFERWLSPTTDSALFNIAEAFLPFSVSGMHRNGDAGVLPVFGPVQMGASQTAVQKRLVKALTAWANNERAGYAYGTVRKGKKTGKPVVLVADILHDAEVNGMDPSKQLDKACGQVLTRLYGQLFAELPEKPGGEYDVRKVSRIVRAINRLGGKKANAVKSLKDRSETQRRSTYPKDPGALATAARRGFDDPYGIEKGYDY